jgi:hypothetical protein
LRVATTRYGRVVDVFIAIASAVKNFHHHQDESGHMQAAVIPLKGL